MRKRLFRKKTKEGLVFLCREGTSDEKTVVEVVENRSYLNNRMTIEKPEHWFDLGGNIGAFSVFAAAKGCKVSVFEPDPFNFELLEKNLKLNGLTAETNQAALVHDEVKTVKLFAAKNGQFWRNSICKNHKRGFVEVPALNFDSIIPDNSCVKMDIEGAEMPILENTKRVFKKLTFEWSFDVDKSIIRFRNVIKKLSENHDVVGNKADKGLRSIHDYWQDSWFPPCQLISCFSRVDLGLDLK